MAKTIENELGREAFTQTIVDGYDRFADIDGLVEEDMRIQRRTAP